MRSIVMYTDGGCGQIEGSRGKRHRIWSWGIVALHDDTHVELHGARRVPVGVDGRTEHELVAFIEAVLYAQSHGFSPECSSYYTDDEFVGYCAFRASSSSSIRSCQRQAVLERINDVCLRWYDIKTFYYLLETFDKSRITKVKGHSTIVNNLRADYLATWARLIEGPTSTKRFLSYDEWLNSHHTIQFWRRWVAPFTNVDTKIPAEFETWLAARQQANC